ncbi:MAG: SemiSWEET transporter [Alteromonas sp.]
MDIQIIGYIAACCTSLSFLPQAVKVIKTRNTDSLSLSMYSVFSFGVLLWLIYGAILGDLPMIFANTITLLFALIILGMKVQHRLLKLRRQQGR